MAADPPKIEFPCDYPIKVLGHQQDTFQREVVQVIVRHDPQFDEQTVRIRQSRNGRFLALSITIRATGAPQLDRLHQDLLALEAVTSVF